jgi:glucokinase
MPDVALALDAGGTKLLGGLVTRDGTVLARDQVPTPRAGDRCDPDLSALRAQASRLRDLAGRDGHRVTAVGLGIAEYVRDGALTSAEVFSWSVQPWDLLSGLGGPVAVEADVRCAALAEASARGAAGKGSLLYLSWGTGLSSALVLDGRCVAGRRGEALALGEWPVPAAVDPGWHGNLERYASGLAMAERYAASTGRAVTGAEVARRARAGESDADAVVASAAAAVAHAVAALVLVLDPDLVVLGGGVGTGDELLARVRTTLAGLLTRPGAPEVEAALAGSDAGLLGAAQVAWQARGAVGR